MNEKVSKPAAKQARIRLVLTVRNQSATNRPDIHLYGEWMPLDKEDELRKQMQKYNAVGGARFFASIQDMPIQESKKRTAAAQHRFIKEAQRVLSVPVSAPKPNVVQVRYTFGRGRNKVYEYVDLADVLRQTHGQRQRLKKYEEVIAASITPERLDAAMRAVSREHGRRGGRSPIKAKGQDLLDADIMDAIERYVKNGEDARVHVKTLAKDYACSVRTVYRKIEKSELTRKKHPR